MDPVLLLDSDIFIILSAAGVLERTAALLGVKLANVRRSEALPRQLARSKSFRQNYPEHIRNAALQQCRTILHFTERPGRPDIADRLTAIEGIHSGEAIMLSLTAEHPFYYLASGDKRSMIALATTASLADIRSAVAGRGKDDPLNLIVEVTGEKKKDKAAKVSTARNLWVPAINNHGGFGRWGFVEVGDPWDAKQMLQSLEHRNGKT